MLTQTRFRAHVLISETTYDHLSLYDPQSELAIYFSLIYGPHSEGHPGAKPMTLGHPVCGVFSYCEQFELVNISSSFASSQEAPVSTSASNVSGALNRRSPLSTFCWTTADAKNSSYQ